jgi:hypothetical protein
MGAVLQQAELEVTGLKADLAKARAVSAPWLQLQLDNKKQARQIKGLEAERDALKNAKIPKVDDVRGVTLEWEAASSES